MKFIPSTKWGSAAFAMAIVLGGGIALNFEGLETNAYYDTGGVTTICVGHTRTAYIGQTMTEEECMTLFEREFAEYARIVERHVKVPMNPELHGALSSFVFNVGEGNFKRSTLLRKLNAGDYEGACNELPRWKYDNGRMLRGLIRRRAAEMELCKQGLGG